jgi:hypothetical protein
MSESVDMDSLVTTYNILLDYIPAVNRQGAADHLMGILVDEMDELDLEELVGQINCEYLRTAYEEYDFEDSADDEDEDEWTYDED